LRDRLSPGPHAKPKPFDWYRRHVVTTRARMAREAGLRAVVCSGETEVKLLHEMFPDLKLIVPGIRFADGDAHDQRNVLTPGKAIAAGADLLVIGRAIRSAKDPVEAARRAAKEIGNGLRLRDAGDHV